MGKKRSKLVTVRYGSISNKPHNKNIEKAIDKWLNKGYTLHSRVDKDAGTLSTTMSLGWARGKTELTFIKED